MAGSDVEAKVREIVCEQLGVTPEEVSPGAAFIEDLGADSLDIVELVMALEEEFDIEVPEEELAEVKTVGQAYDLVVGKL